MVMLVKASSGDADAAAFGPSQGHVIRSSTSTPQPYAVLIILMTDILSL